MENIREELIKDIDELTIKAPVAGIVGTRYYELGEYLHTLQGDWRTTL